MIRRIQNKAKALVRRTAEKRKINKLFDKYRSATMALSPVFQANLETAISVLKNRKLDGACIVECGTWRGGMSAALAEIGGRDRDYYFFDSFAGLPPAKPIDGDVAITWQAKAPSENIDNCTATIEEFQKTISLADIPEQRLHIIKGFFENTLPTFSPHSIAILRLDGDWYDSTMICLKTFWDHVLPGGAILIDDYYWWDGCSRAVHDFLSSIKAVEKIEEKSNCLAVIIRKADD